MSEQKKGFTCEFPGEFITVRESKMHYIDIGQGEPIIFLHGVPTFSYLWRHILPGLAEHARCIAPDLIGMGFSDKPDINYTVFEHINFIEEFIAALDIPNFTLVVHEWGSVIGLAIAARYPEKINAIAFFESYLRPLTNRKMLSLPVQHLVAYLSRPGVAYPAIVTQNYFLNEVLPASAICALSEEILKMYRHPFQTIASRRVLWQYAQDALLDSSTDQVIDLIESYSNWLQQTSIPKLLLYAMPGFITTIQTVSWAKDHLPNLEIDSLEDVLHLAQESAPELFTEKLRSWYLEKVLALESIEY